MLDCPYAIMEDIETDSGISCCEQAKSADAEVVLDDGRTYKVHAALLSLGSSVLSDAVQLASEQPLHQRLKVPLPCTTGNEAVALINLLYSSRRESYALALPLEQLCLLSSVCNRFLFEDIHGLVDQTMTKHSGDFCSQELQDQPRLEQYLKPANAAGLYWKARSEGLHCFEMACAGYIGMNMKEVAEAAPKDALAPVLAQAAPGGVSPALLEELQSELPQILQGMGVTASSATQYGSVYVRFFNLVEKILKIKRVV